MVYYLQVLNIVRGKGPKHKNALSIITIICFDACIMAHVMYCFLLANEEVLLNEDDLVDIIDALEGSGFTISKWHKLGLQLRILNSNLNTIETNYPKDVDRCLVECLVKWLKTGKATYTGLAEALKKMGEGAAADHISSVLRKRDHAEKCVEGM